MLTRFLFLVLSLMVLASTAAPTAALADRHLQLLARRGGDSSGVSLNEAVQQVQRDTGGRVLSAETVNQGGRSVHRIKVLMPSGQVRVVTVDAGR